MKFVLIMILVAIASSAVTAWYLSRRQAAMARARATAPRPDDGGMFMTAPAEMIREASGQVPAGALALLDVDGLKGVNERQGYDTGDRLLAAVGDVLQRSLPEGAEFERLGDARFLLHLEETGLEDAWDATERLRRFASQTIVQGRLGPVSRSVSAGLVSSFADESHARTVLRADAALARAKGDGGNRTEGVRGAPALVLAPPRHEVEAAIEAKALEYHVQPIVDLAGEEIVGVEALLRWNREDGAVIGPGAFIDTLDRIPEAGADLFPALAVEAASRFVTGPSAIYTTFNVTGMVLDGEDGPGRRWMDTLLDRLPPDRVVLEIVETAILIDPERSLAVVRELRERGVRIALDDFGTGMSNLERLRHLPVDIVKMDRAFTDGLGGGGARRGDPVVDARADGVRSAST